MFSSGIVQAALQTSLSLPFHPLPSVLVLPEGDKEQLVSGAVTYFSPEKTEPDRTGGKQRKYHSIHPSVSPVIYFMTLIGGMGYDRIEQRKVIMDLNVRFQIFQG